MSQTPAKDKNRPAQSRSIALPSNLARNTKKKPIAKKPAASSWLLKVVDQVMQQEPYHSAPRVFWIVDNGSSHRGAKARRELAARYPNLILVHLPTHASWLHQIEIYCSIIQRKVLTPNDFADLAAVEQRLLAFEDRYNQTAQPFAWTFTRQDLARRLAQLQPALRRDQDLDQAA